MKRTFVTVFAATLCAAAPAQESPKPKPTPVEQAPVTTKLPSPVPKEQLRSKAHADQAAPDSSPDSHARKAAEPKDDEAWERFRKEHPEAASHIMDEADANDDGKLDGAERERAFHRMRRMHHERADKAERKERREAGKEHVKAKADTDGDGRVGPEERQAVRERVKERADRNDDGKVGPRERHEAKEHVKAAKERARAQAEDAPKADPAKRAARPEPKRPASSAGLESTPRR